MNVRQDSTRKDKSVNNLGELHKKYELGDGRKYLTKYFYRSVCAIIITIVCSSMFFFVWYSFVTEHNQTGHLTGIGNLGMSVLIYTVILVVALHGLGGFSIGVNRKMKIIASQIVGIFSTNLVDILISMAVTGQFRFGMILFCEYVVLALVQSGVVFILTSFMVNLYRKTFPPLQIIKINGEHENQLTYKINSRPDKYHIAKEIGIDGDEEHLRNVIMHYDAVLLNDLPSYVENRILKICFDQDKRVYFTPKISDIIVKASDDLNLFDTPLYFCRNIGMSFHQRFIKRTLDLVLSILALIVLSPVFLITAVFIHLEDGGPVFFTQERVTLGGKRFKIYKFRSMIVDAEKDGKPHPAGEIDDRITRVGRFIRATRIDELPQLINIVKNEMSIVGPRPERWEHHEMYSKEIPEFEYRLKVKGGLTGYAQVYGKYNTSALDKLKLDMMYIMNYSLLLDIQIVFETIKVIFSKESTEGFSEDRAANLHEFDNKE